MIWPDPLGTVSNEHPEECRERSRNGTEMRKIGPGRKPKWKAGLTVQGWAQSVGLL
jgi:hypothetical protein